MKNGWAENFVEKWQYLSRCKEDSAAVATISTTSSHDFLGAADWLPLAKAKADVPKFTMQHMLSYLIDRKATDSESNKDYKNICSKAFGLFRHGHVQNIELAADAQCAHFRCACLPDMKKTLKYKLQLSMVKAGDRSGEIVYASCHPCPAGKGPQASCKHIAALCYALEEFGRLQSTREFETCTERLQAWNQPRKRKLDAERVYDIDFTRKVYGKEEKERKKTLVDPRLPSHRDKYSSNVNKCMLTGITRVKPNCGFFFLLSNEKLAGESLEDQSQCLPAESTCVVNIISPPKQQPLSLQEIFERASRVKQKLFVDEEERKRIKLSTQNQSKCSEWFQHRQVRITASKCKRAIQKPSTSPTKAMCEILHYSKSYQSKQMKQGLQDEKVILKMYEHNMGCEVKHVGFVISATHPFLGASPDGEVDGGLVEVKRLFPHVGMSLCDAACSRNICKATRNGLIINTNRKFYFQVQHQMFCTDSKWTDLVLSDLNDVVVLHVKRSNSFLSKMIPRLEDFYDSHISLELAYPRVAYGLPRLGKVIQRKD